MIYSKINKKNKITILISFISAISIAFTGCDDQSITEDIQTVAETQELSLKSFPYYDSYAAKNLPTPPTGKTWEFVPTYSDEFHGPYLNESKWLPRIPTWKGRVPGFFVSDNVSIVDDKLVLSNTWLDTPIWDNGNKYTIGCAAVMSKNSALIYPCYTEVKMKASDVPLSSTFWLMAGSSKKYPNDNNCQYKYTTELDVIETVGGPYSWDSSIKGFATQMKSNTHFRTRPCNGGSETFHSVHPNAKNLGFTTQSGYHTYGVYWINAKKCNIYVDHKYFYSINFYKGLKDNPFDLSMGLRMVTETYDWLKHPTKDMLKNNPEKAKTRYEFVRTYKLVNK